jgi:gluconolactonase
MKRTIASLAVLVAATAAAAQTLPGERPTAIAAIPGVVAAGAKWELVRASLVNMDGMVAAPDGGVFFAQEQTGTVRRVDPKGQESVHLAATHGAGALSIDARGRMYAVERTCTDPGLGLGAGCREPTMVTQLLPERRVLADSLPGGRPIGRPSDLIADGRGGVYFTARGGAYYVDPQGAVSVVAGPADTRANGIMLSPDGRILYMTNGTNVLVFDVGAGGAAGNRRVFGELDSSGGGDGMAIDGRGRLYVAATSGVHVFAPEGRKLGVIPMPRKAVTIAFAGPGKKTLYAVGEGGVGPDGKAWAPPKGVRNTAKTLYRIPLLAEGFRGRPK